MCLAWCAHIARSGIARCLPGAPIRPTSENFVPTNFAESPKGEVRRITLLRGWVNKDHHARLRLLVNDEHAPAKLIRCSPEPALGAQILWSTLFELLICGGKLAGRELFTSAGCHYDAQSASSSSTNQPSINCGLRAAKGKGNRPARQSSLRRAPLPPTRVNKPPRSLLCQTDQSWLAKCSMCIMLKLCYSDTLVC